MNATSSLIAFPNLRRINANMMWLGLAVMGLVLLAFGAHAATTGGTALQGAFTLLDEMVAGYGKQLLTVIGFAVAAIGYMAANATSVIMKFVGFAIFLAVGLPAAVGLVGAVI